MVDGAVVRRAVALAALLLAVGGCNNAADEQAKANAAQAKANVKIDEAGRDAKAAQADADRAIAEARAGFTKMREDYRHETMVNLADLDKKIADLSAKAKTSTGKAKADLDASMKLIVVSRDAYLADYRSIETASATTWDETKARLEKERTDLKALVDKALSGPTT